ncbi:Pal1-domain-containing protein [Xylona heveae TC161]|uniref:Pal1-domain-containing protein n=1 Tax=Xylona heveae (strain CBS 132557 / TC161) TaxID=1328760 RepID=A0A165GH72_XYLHT|nr:Pal1-domain-containing protein [Xylona heveae TC161]KZF22180.1 Pal1-domain-containing protein [Xylona heveae TC161]
MDRASKIFAETEQEERRRRRREREARHKDERRREKGSSSRSKRHLQTLDLIDKLDVTGLYGPGQFHHDGPFDACNPHRNRKKDGRAPMQAFPEDSTNNALGGPGPLNKNIDLNLFHGRTADATQDFGSAGLEPEGIRPRGADRPEDFNANQRITQVHGDESMGLGTSTFLEGAPASRSAIQRRQSETEGTAPQFAGGLQRKRSLAQRIRGISANPHSNGRIVSPEPRYDFRGSGELSPRQPITVQSAGGRSRLSEKNPFFHDYDDAYEKKGASIKIAENERTGRARTPSSPMRGLERRSTSDGYGEPESKPSGFLSRVKSIKGPRRSRPER